MITFKSFLYEDTEYMGHKIKRHVDGKWGWERGTGYQTLSAVMSAIEKYERNKGTGTKMS